MVIVVKDALERLHYLCCLQTGSDLSQPHGWGGGGGRGGRGGVGWISARYRICLLYYIIGSVLISRMFMQLTIRSLVVTKCNLLAIERYLLQLLTDFCMEVYSH